MIRTIVACLAILLLFLAAIVGAVLTWDAHEDLIAWYFIGAVLVFPLLATMLSAWADRDPNR
jgi:hypothetical protein